MPIAIGDYLILDALRSSGGTAITVTDDQLLEGMRLGMTLEGISVSPESGAAIIATQILRQQDFLKADDEVLIFSTGSGLMHTDLIPIEDLEVLDPSDSIRDTVQ